MIISDKDIVKCLRHSNKFAIDCFINSLYLSVTETKILILVAENNLTQEQISFEVGYSYRHTQRIINKLIVKIKRIIEKYDSLNPELKKLIEIIFFDYDVF